MDQLERSRRLQKRKLHVQYERILKIAKAEPSKTLIQDLEEEFKEFSSQKDVFENIQMQISPLLDLTNSKTAEVTETAFVKESIEVSGWAVDIAKKIRKIRDQLSDINKRDSLLSSTITATASSSVKLPKIEIPKFNGDVRLFIDFASLFRNLIVDNADISNIQKLYYLKQSLIGDAESLVRDFELEDNSFAEAWSTVVSRYENKRSIIGTHFEDLFSVKKIKSEKEIRKLLDDVNAALRGLKIAGENVEGWSSIVSYFVCSKLDDDTRREWENSLTDNSFYPSYKSIRAFLETRASNIEARASSRQDVSKNVKRLYVTSLKPSRIKCYDCGQNHWLADCARFKARTSADRFNFVKQNKLCIACFSDKHSCASCRSKCFVCSKSHHTLLHRESNSLPIAPGPTKCEDPNRESPPSIPKSDQKLVCNTVTRRNNLILLPTAVVLVQIPDRPARLARVLFDNASQVTLVSAEFVKKACLPVQDNSYPLSIQGLTDQLLIADSCSSFKIKSRICNFELTIKADIVPKISYSPAEPVLQLIRMQNYKAELADSKLCHDRVDILLGAEYVEACFLDERRKIEQLTLRKSVFGWVVSGPTRELTDSKKFSVPLSCNLTISNIERQLRQFWEIEEVEVDRQKLTELDPYMRHFVNTYTRDLEGRFVVRLPTKEDRTVLSDSRSRSLIMLRKIEQRLDEEEKRQYVEFMREYKNLGHMERVRDESGDSIKYYIPHRAVLRPTSSTTKFRVVFNASAKTASGISLNDILIVGPKLQSDLFDILIKFRRHLIVFICDIEKMYRQIWVHTSDQDLQRILWREHPHEPIKEYRLKTVTYGTSSASFLAQSCLRRLADETVVIDPIASETIREDFYMDDLITGTDDLESACRLQTAIHSILGEAGFPLRKYKSNSPKLLTRIKPALLDSAVTFDFVGDSEFPVLGLLWCPKSDCFKVKLNLGELPPILSKRILLSCIGRIFDPLGFLSPVIITAKRLLQELWSAKLSWDEPLPTDIATKFYQFHSNISVLHDWKIPRVYSLINPAERTESLIGFCDASAAAYCAVVYLRSSCNSTTSVRFVCSKTKVAPVRQITIPRLELQAALLLSSLLKRVSLILKIPASNVFAFSDSTIVLSWLNMEPDKWQIYVANRTRKILDAIPADKWSFVRTHENPSDLGTRGITAQELLTNRSWFAGPEFLLEFVFEKFARLVRLSDIADLPERRTLKTALKISKFIQDPCELFNKFSAMPKLTSVVGYVLRFSSNCRTLPINRVKEPFLTTIERRNAFIALIRLMQRESFASEIVSLETSNSVPAKSRLSRLLPTLDHNGLLRVNGRLDRSSFSSDFKFPIILDGKHKFYELLVEYVHRLHFHATPSFIENFIKAKYYVIDGLRRIIKKVCWACVECKRNRARTMEQLMGSLPPDRVQYSRPFAYVGVDFCGPFLTKCVAHRTTKSSKAYGAFFVCFVTRAVHIEFVSSLTADRFIDAFKRFISRRGTPTRVYSDHGTNFLGARNLLKAGKIDILDFWSRHNVEWQFIPPRSPHFGGLWEAAIRVGKKYLLGSTKQRILNFEDYTTLFAQVEFILNSRPISYKKVSEHSLAVLTPSHFLTGDSLAITRFDHVDIELNRPATSQLIGKFEANRQIISAFWHRWRNDYLHHLQCRNKWIRKEKNLEKGDVVLLKDDSLKPGEWKLGLVETAILGHDGLVRVADVKTSEGLRRRPVCKLVPLISDGLSSTPSRGVC